MNQTFPIESPLAQKVWNNFDRELLHKLKPLPKGEQEDVRLEILSHLYESTAQGQGDTEEFRLIDAIERLGAPEEYLEPLISDILLNQKIANGYPLAVLQSLIASAKQGAFHTLATLVLGMGYFWIIMIFIMSVMHIGNPDVGIWYYETGGLSLSFSAQPDGIQWQPKWFSLIGITSSAFAYWTLNKLLRVLLIKSKIK